MEVGLWRAINQLEPLRPRFVSVTYGAGGSTRKRTHATLSRIRRETSLAAAAHLTCVGAKREEINDIARQYHQSGITHIVALRGDPPSAASGQKPNAASAAFLPGGHYDARPGEYANAEELVMGLKAIGDFDITVAAYPETHPEAASPAADIDYLKRKIDAGASRAITQFFFDPDIYFDFVKRARKAGITVELVPGILPINDCARALRFSRRCGVFVPKWVRSLFEGLDENPNTRNLVAATIAAYQCQRLYAGGVRQFHFYTLNRPQLTLAICHILGVRPHCPPASKDHGNLS